VLSSKVSGIPLYALNAPPTRHRVRRGELILFRGAIIAECIVRPNRADEVVK
jgi:hypothetical protein